MKEDLLNVLLVMYRLRLPRESWRSGSSVLIVTAMCLSYAVCQSRVKGIHCNGSQGMAIYILLFQQRLFSISLTAIHLRRLRFVDLSLGL